MDRIVRMLAGTVFLALAGPWALAVDRQEYRQLADEMVRHFDRHIVKAWFPHCVDVEKGGFRSGFSRDWKALPRQDRFLVFQSRMTWVSAQIALHRPALREEYLNHARHGVAMLGRMWDSEQGGMFWGTDEDAKPTANHGLRKHAYGMSFAIYALAAAYQATGDQAAIDLAMKTFTWFDDHAHDAKNGGYHETLERDGTPVLPADIAKTRDNGLPFPNRVAPYKSMNSHIHLLEAITQLYHVKKDPRVKQRLQEMLLVVRDKIAVEPGCLCLYFTPDWKPVPDHDSFGHDIETAFLLIEAAETLGPVDPRTLTVARQLVDHALDWGFDDQRGGFYDKGAAFDRAHDTAKVWWTQAEGLNALLLMHEHFGKQTDRYWNAFKLTWKFVNDHMVDHEQGGWYETVAADGHVEKATKASNWKAGYHDGRALLNMEKMLRKLATDR